MRRSKALPRCLAQRGVQARVRDLALSDLVLKFVNTSPEAPRRCFVFFQDSTKLLAVFPLQSLHLSKKTPLFASSLKADPLCAGAPEPRDSERQGEQEAEELSPHAREVERLPGKLHAAAARCISFECDESFSAKIK